MVGFDTVWIQAPFCTGLGFQDQYVLKAGYTSRGQLQSGIIEIGGAAPQKRAAVCKIQGQDSIGLQVQLPYLNNINNLEPCGIKTTQDTMRDLLRNLQQLGIYIDEKGMKATRLDICCNLQTCRPFPSYGLLMDSLGAERLRKLPGKRYSKTWDTWGNKSRAIVIYDKASQSLLEGNIIRLEARFYGCKSIERHINSKYWHDIMQLTEQELGSIYKKQVRGLFRYDYSEYQNMLENLHFDTVESIIADPSRGKGNPIEKILAALAIRGQVVTRQDLTDLVLLAIDRIGYEGPQKWNKRSKYKKDINRVFDSAVGTIATDAGLRLIDQYQELREGFLYEAEIAA